MSSLIRLVSLSPGTQMVSLASRVAGAALMTSFIGMLPCGCVHGARPGTGFAPVVRRELGGGQLGQSSCRGGAVGWLGRECAGESGHLPLGSGVHGALRQRPWRQRTGESWQQQGRIDNGATSRATMLGTAALVAVASVMAWSIITVAGGWLSRSLRGRGWRERLPVEQRAPSWGVHECVRPGTK
uniref:hypothetical protein n=1 Tax=Nonomuraea sp. CA-252377 TaxID=3240003 RepID=UPI003F497862